MGWALQAERFWLKNWFLYTLVWTSLLGSGQGFFAAVIETHVGNEKNTLFWANRCLWVAYL